VSVIGAQELRGDWSSGGVLYGPSGQMPLWTVFTPW
jgi:hypothetical protein